MPPPSPSTTNVVPSDPLLLDLQTVYRDLAQHRKDITRLMANVKKCSTKLERRLGVEHDTPSLTNTSYTEDTTGTMHTLQPLPLKGGHKSKPNSKPKRKGGLAKPYPVSTSLCAFMDVPQGTQLARAEVTKYLHSYIRDKNLYDQKDKQYIKLDSSLKSLFNMTQESDPRVHIFSMQKKMNPHFRYAQAGSTSSHMTKTSSSSSGGSGTLVHTDVNMGAHMEKEANDAGQ